MELVIHSILSFIIMKLYVYVILYEIYIIYHKNINNIYNKYIQYIIVYININIYIKCTHTSYIERKIFFYLTFTKISPVSYHLGQA